MNPDQNQNQYSIDYLNEIAPQQKPKGVKDTFFLYIVGGGLLVAAITLILVLTSGSGPTQKMQTLAARLTTLQTIASDNQKSLKSGALRSTNSNLTLFLTNTNRDIVQPLASSGVDVKKVDSNIAAKENGEELKQALEDARLNAVLDRTYAREMAYQLQTVAVLLQDIYDSTNSKSLKEFLEKTNVDLQPLIQQFSDFTE
jgi:hypothetical protein